MVKITNVFGDQYSGQAGKAGVFARWKGRQYRRKYVIPANPNTTMQQAVRGNLTAGVTRWHSYSTVQRLAYDYMAVGQVMSGYNLFCSRWQKQMPNSETNMIAPPYGIKQIGHTKTARTHTNPAPTNHSYALGFKPVEIGSLVYTPAGTDPNQDCYVDIEMGWVRTRVAINDTKGAKAGGTALAPGDKLLISYHSQGRTITREVLYTVPSGESSIPQKNTVQDCYKTDYFPIDYGTVVIETEDVSPTPHVWTQLESLEIDNVIGKIYYDLTDAADAATKVDYNSYTAYENAKLQVTKTNTSFVTWRDYSDTNGHIPIAQTIEDETYDLTYEVTGKSPVIKTAQSALLTSQPEYIAFSAP